MVATSTSLRFLGSFRLKAANFGPNRRVGCISSCVDPCGVLGLPVQGCKVIPTPTPPPKGASGQLVAKGPGVSWVTCPKHLNYVHGCLQPHHPSPLYPNRDPSMGYAATLILTRSWDFEMAKVMQPL